MGGNEAGGTIGVCGEKTHKSLRSPVSQGRTADPEEIGLEFDRETFPRTCQQSWWALGASLPLESRSRPTSVAASPRGAWHRPGPMPEGVTRLEPTSGRRGAQEGRRAARSRGAVAAMFIPSSPARAGHCVTADTGPSGSDSPVLSLATRPLEESPRVGEVLLTRFAASRPLQYSHLFCCSSCSQYVMSWRLGA